MDSKTKKPKGRPPRHGGYSIMTRGDVLARNRPIRAYLSAIREGLIRDHGPREQDLTTSQLALINHTISKLGVLRLIEEHVQKNGIFLGGELDPALGKFWLAASNSLRLDLTALGINTKKGEEALSLEKYITLNAESIVGTESAAVDMLGQAPTEIACPGASSCEKKPSEGRDDDREERGRQ